VSQEKLIRGTFEVIGNAIDEQKPNGTLSGINSTYTQGDSVNMSIGANDNEKLYKITLHIANDNERIVDESWYSSDTSFAKNYTLDTGNLSGTYYATLFVKDDAGNLFTTQTQEFSVNESSTPTDTTGDTQKPNGTLSGINSSYTQGDSVNMSIGANDNQQF